MDSRILDILDNITDGCFILNNDGNCVYINHQAKVMIGKKSEEAIEKNVLMELIDTSLYKEYCLAKDDMQVRKFECYLPQQQKWFEIKVYPDKEDTIIYMKDINQKKTDKYKIQLDNDIERLQAIFENSALAIGIVTLDGIPIDCNQALLNMLGYTMEELSTMRFHDISHPEDLEKDVELFKKLINKEINKYTIEKRYIRKDHEIFWARLTVSAISDRLGTARYIMSIMENITELKFIEEQKSLNLKEWKRLSSIDGLTEINNRRAFDQEIKKEWKACLNSNAPMSLVLLDIDFFKAYNDFYGHLKGDECLKKIAKTIENSLEFYCVHICRYGGEEFAIILPNIDEKEAQQIANKIRRDIEILKIEHLGNDHRNYVTISAGISTIIPSKFSTPEDLIISADKALYQAKDKGRNNVIMYMNVTSSLKETGTFPC